MASNYNRKSVSSGSRSGSSAPRTRVSADSPGRSVRMPQSNPRSTGRPTVGSYGGSRSSGGSYSGSRSQGFRSYGGSGGGRPSGSRGQVSSVRLGDLQDDGRRARMQSNYRSHMRHVFIVLSLLAAAVAVYAVLYFVGAFAIKNLTVSGSEHLTTEEVSELAAVSENSTLLRVDAQAICKRLESNPWVESASVSRIPPDTLELVITERTIDAVIEVTTSDGEGTEDWAIASDGMWLMSIPDEDSEEAADISQAVYEDADKVLHITDVPYGLEPEEGSYCDDESVINALNIVSGLTTELADKVVSVSADGSENATLTLKSGVEIAFGSDEDIRDKERVCLKLLEKHSGKIAYINVRTPSSPTWRSL